MTARVKVRVKVRTAQMRTAKLRAAGAALALAGVVVLAGCGIRTTSVPVDAGAAPSRMPCEVDKKDVITRSSPGVPVRVYLVCASGLVSVERSAQIPLQRTADDREKIAQALLDELQAQPSSSEHAAGFTTYVQPPLILGSDRKGDPPGTLRISRQPEDLASSALAQIVCTFVENGATDESQARAGQVVLGGPGDYPAHGYRCDKELKTRPDAPVPTFGPLPSASAE